MRISSIRWGVIWIGIGLLFLAINLELLDSLVFPRLFSLWPVLLIAIGVELIFRRTRLYFLAFLSPLLIAGAFMIAATAKGDWGWESDEFWRRWVWKANEKKIDIAEIPSDSTVSFLELNLECGPSEIIIKPSNDRIFKATTEYHKKSPWVEQRMDGAVEKVNYMNREKTRLTLLGINISVSRSEFEIAGFLPLNATINATDDTPDLDFRGLMLNSLDLDIRSNRAWLQFGERDDTVDVAISGRTDELKLTIPDDFSISVEGDSARLQSLFNGSELIRRSGTIYSDNLNSNRVIRIMLNARIGHLDIVRD